MLAFCQVSIAIIDVVIRNCPQRQLTLAAGLGVMLRRKLLWTPAPIAFVFLLALTIARSTVAATGCGTVAVTSVRIVARYSFGGTVRGR